MNDLPESLEGYWYLPGRRSTKIPGVLQFFESGDIRLRLFGWLYPEEPTGMIYQAPDIILGETSEFGDITLVDCFVCSGPSRRTVAGEVEILGSEFGALAAHYRVHISKRDAIKTNIVRASFSDESLWQIPPPFKKRDLQRVSRRFQGKEPFVLTPLKPKLLYRGPDFTVRYIEQVANAGRTARSPYELQQFLEIQSRHKWHIDEYRMLIIALEAYLSFIGRSRVYRTSVAYKFSISSKFNPWIRIKERFLRFAHTNHPADRERHLSADRLSTLSDVLKRYPSSPVKWLENYQNFFPVYLLYLSSLEPNTTVDQSVFSLIQACEGFFGRTKKRKANLNQIMELLVSEVPPKVAQFIGDAKKFGSEIVRIRNYYAHYSAKEKPYPYSPNELADARRKLQILMEVHFLAWMGLSSADVMACVNNVWSYYGRV